MNLTEKDRDFLRQLKELVESGDLTVELRPGQPGYMVLRGNYGEKIHRAFRMTRQGVRWRFWRIFNDMYISAFSTILVIEKTFGSRLRDYAIRISKERYTLQQALVQTGFQSADTLLPGSHVRRRDQRSEAEQQDSAENDPE